MKTIHQSEVWINKYFKIAAASKGGDDYVTKLFSSTI